MFNESRWLMFCGSVCVVLALVFFSVLGLAQGWIDSNGNPIPADYGTFTPAAITLTTNTNTQLIAPVAGSTIRVAHLSFSAVAATTIQFFSSTGAACAGAVAISGIYQNVQSMALDFPAGALRPPVGRGLCMQQGLNQNLGGMITYGQHP